MSVSGVHARSCVYAYFFQLKKSWLSISGREAECVPRLSMEQLRDKIIAVSSASLPIWETYFIIIQLLLVSDENIYTQLVFGDLPSQTEAHTEPSSLQAFELWVLADVS